jgi:transcription initiation factor TFIIIB Brf1 subunit/transcription initiation factor TFIIB
MECDHPRDARVHDRSTGDEICTECGQVLEAFAFDFPCDMCDMSYDMHDVPPECNSTSVMRRETDPMSSTLDERTGRKVRRICEHVRVMAHAMKLTDRVIEVSDRLVTEVCARGMTVRDGIMCEIAASALYYACKLEHVDRAEVEIAANCGIALKHVVLTNKRFRRTLATTSFGPLLCAPANPLRLIPRFLEVLCAGPVPIVPRTQKHRMRTRCEDIGARAVRSGTLEGKSPECCCITFIFKAMMELGFPADTLSSVCVRCGLTPNTILNALNILDGTTV